MCQSDDHDSLLHLRRSFGRWFPIENADMVYTTNSFCFDLKVLTTTVSRLCGILHSKDSCGDCVMSVPLSVCLCLSVSLMTRDAQVAEFATQFFITDNKCNCAGLVLAGSAEFKHELQVQRRSREYATSPRPTVDFRYLVQY